MGLRALVQRTSRVASRLWTTSEGVGAFLMSDAVTE